MKTKSIITALNLTDGEVLTLEKMADRMEFEAFAMMPDATRTGYCTCYIGLNVPIDCPLKGACGELSLDPCDCKGPHGYIDCHPYK